MPDSLPVSTLPATPEQLAKGATDFVSAARIKAENGLTVAEFGSLVIDLLHLLVSGLDQISSLDGPAKKAWALSVVAVLFDSVAGYAVPVALLPFWVLSKPLIRALVLAAASGALERVLQLSRAANAAPQAQEPTK